MPDMLEVLAVVGLKPPIGIATDDWCRQVAEEIRQNYGLDAELLQWVREATGCAYEDFSGRAAVQHTLTRVMTAHREMKAQIEPLRALLAEYQAIAATVPLSFLGDDSAGPKPLAAMLRRWNDVLVRSKRCAFDAHDDELVNAIRVSLGLEVTP